MDDELLIQKPKNTDRIWKLLLFGCTICTVIALTVTGLSFIHFSNTTLPTQRTFAELLQRAINASSHYDVQVGTGWNSTSETYTLQIYYPTVNRTNLTYYEYWSYEYQLYRDIEKTWMPSIHVYDLKLSEYSFLKPYTWFNWFNVSYETNIYASEFLTEFVLLDEIEELLNFASSEDDIRLFTHYYGDSVITSAQLATLNRNITFISYNDTYIINSERKLGFSEWETMPLNLNITFQNTTFVYELNSWNSYIPDGEVPLLVFRSSNPYVNYSETITSPGTNFYDFGGDNITSTRCYTTMNYIYQAYAIGVSNMTNVTFWGEAVSNGCSTIQYNTNFTNFGSCCFR